MHSFGSRDFYKHVKNPKERRQALNQIQNTMYVERRDLAVSRLQSMTTKYPQIQVQLTGRDGNAFAVIGTVMGSLRRAKDDEGKRLVSDSQIDEFIEECESGDYDHLLQTCMKWVDVN